MKKFENNQKDFTRKKPENVIDYISITTEAKNISTQEVTENPGLDSILDMVKQVPFNIVSIPLTLSKAKAFDNADAKGYVNVGYIYAFDPETNKFKVMILERFKDKVKSSGTISVVTRKDRKTNEPNFITAFSFNETGFEKVFTGYIKKDSE